VGRGENTTTHCGDKKIFQNNFSTLSRLENAPKWPKNATFSPSVNKLGGTV